VPSNYSIHGRVTNVIGYSRISFEFHRRLPKALSGIADQNAICRLLGSAEDEAERAMPDAMC
jgi:hypothetical protein